MSLKKFLPAVAPGWPDIPLWDKNTIARAAGTPDRWGMNDQAVAFDERTEFLKDATEKLNAEQESVINVMRFGVTPESEDIGPALNEALSYAAETGRRLVIPAGRYTQKTPAILTSDQIINNTGVSIEGLGSFRAVRIDYSGTGHALSILGKGTEGEQPITRFSIRNVWWYGGDNTESDGGIFIDRCYILQVRECSSSGWGKSTAVAAEFRNVFNCKVEGGNYANGYPGVTGQAAIRVGSKNSLSVGTDAWNTSNVIITNLLVQHAKYGIEVAHDGNIFDNLTIDNVSLGKNGQWGIYCRNPNVNNIKIVNNHFESGGYNESNIPNSNTGHITIHRSRGVEISNNSFQDALLYIDLDSVPAFDIGRGNKFFETGNYSLTGNILLKLRTSTAACIGSFGENDIRTDQIDVLYDLVESNGFRIDLARRFRTKSIEANWNTAVFPNPTSYQGTVVDRYQSTNAPFDMMVSAGSSWYRMMVSSMYKGERTSIPTTVENLGSFYLNKSATLDGPTGSKYLVFGWYCMGGSAWKPLRMLTGD